MKLNDIEKFIHQARSERGRFFDGRGSILVTRAPGRLDVMGGIADYSGSLVMEIPLTEAAKVALQRREDDRVRLGISGVVSRGMEPAVTLSLADFHRGSQLKSYQEIHDFLTRDPRTRWIAYVAGAFYVLRAERYLERFPGGANLLLSSDVPVGSGVASSAAIEVATMKAVAAAYGITPDGLTLARLCQMVENRVVGAPCGIMDQVTAALGQAGELIILRCQPHDILGYTRFPPGSRVVGINSHVHHSVAGSRYTRVRVAAFMGLKILTDHLGEDPWNGYLANLSPKDYRHHFAPLLPSRMKGCDFLARYGETDDPVTGVDPETVYSVRACTEHPVYENHRVNVFRESLEGFDRTGDESLLVRAGQQMYGSHWSYSRCGLGSRATDILVRLVRQRGPGKGFYGAKITGGGSGGTVAILVRGDVTEDLKMILQEYQALTGVSPQLFDGTSPGAFVFGERVVV